MKTRAIIPTRYLILTIVLMLLPVGRILAADITVDADCSLANAIRSANGEEMVEPRLNCEPENVEDESNQADDDQMDDQADDDQDQPDDDQMVELRKIIIDVSGTETGEITLDETLFVGSHIAIDGNGVSINGAGQQIFRIHAGSLTLNNLTVSGGFSEGNGGAIEVIGAALTLNNSVVRASGARGFGGGIYALDSNVTLISSAISNNASGTPPEDDLPVTEEDAAVEGDGDAQSATADQEAGTDQEGAEEAAPQAVALGGGLFFAGESSSLLMDRSGVDGNWSSGAGGGIYISSGSAEIINSTISGNRAGVDGGGVYNVGGSVFRHVTIIGNEALNGGGIVDAAVLQLYNSILSDNSGGDCLGSLNGNLGNIIRDNTCNHDGSNADPNLLLLAGLPTYYMPYEDSPAVDAALAEYCPSIDQRGIERLPEACDIGAAEYQADVFNFQVQSALAALSPGAGGGATSSSGDDDDKDKDDKDEEGADLQPTLTPSNCGDLPGHITVTGATSSLHCRMLDWAGVGNQTLVDGGALHAVDLFGWVATPVTVCFQHSSGAIVLLDAANAPRNIIPLRTWQVGNRQCAIVDRPGSAVFMPLEFFASGAIDEPAWELNGCTVATTEVLNLREGPSSDTAHLANVLNDLTLTADRKTTFWYRVDHSGITGWLRRDYLALSDNC